MWNFICHACQQQIHHVKTNNAEKLSEYQKETLIIKLKLLQKTLVMKAVVGGENTAITVSYPNVLLEFGQEQIYQILSHVETIFTLGHL